MFEVGPQASRWFDEFEAPSAHALWKESLTYGPKRATLCSRLAAGILVSSAMPHFLDRDCIKVLFVHQIPEEQDDR